MFPPHFAPNGWKDNDIASLSRKFGKTVSQWIPVMALGMFAWSGPRRKPRPTHNVASSRYVVLSYGKVLSRQFSTHAVLK